MKAGKVTRLKTPKTKRNDSRMQDPMEDRCCVTVSQSTRDPKSRRPTLLWVILAISTRLHATNNVSNEFEKV